MDMAVACFLFSPIGGISSSAAPGGGAESVQGSILLPEIFHRTSSTPHSENHMNSLFCTTFFCSKNHGHSFLVFKWRHFFGQKLALLVPRHFAGETSPSGSRAWLLPFWPHWSIKALDLGVGIDKKGTKPGGRHVNKKQTHGRLFLVKHYILLFAELEKICTMCCLNKFQKCGGYIAVKPCFNLIHDLWGGDPPRGTRHTHAT